MTIMKKVIVGVKQRLLTQKLNRTPEDSMVMYNHEQDRQYTKDGDEGSLAILYEYMINSLLKVSPTKGDALDICCGSSQLLCKLANQLPNVNFTGLDLSPNMLKFAKKSREQYGVNNVGFQEGSMFDLDKIFDKKFDLITWHLALHHCDTKEQVITVFNQIAKLAKPDATVFIFDIIRPKTDQLAIQYSDIFNTRQGNWYYDDSLASYRAAFSFEEMEEMLKASDLKSYQHVQPWVANFHQMISISKRVNIDLKPASNLKHLWQKVDYKLLKLTFPNGLSKSGHELF